MMPAGHAIARVTPTLLLLLLASYAAAVAPPPAAKQAPPPKPRGSPKASKASPPPAPATKPSPRTAVSPPPAVAKPQPAGPRKAPPPISSATPSPATQSKPSPPRPSPRPPPPASPWHPLCPNALPSSDDKARCYARVIQRFAQDIIDIKPNAHLGAIANFSNHFDIGNLISRSDLGIWRGIGAVGWLTTFTTVQAASGRTVDPKATVTSFTTSGNVAAADIYYTARSSSAAGNWSYKVFVRFNDYNKISAMDTVWVDHMKFLATFNELPMPSDYASFNARSTPSICNAIMTYCTGALAQYTSLEDCTSYLNPKPHIMLTTGDYNGDCVGCRAIQSLLLPLDVNLYCPVMGRTGGGICTDRPDTSLYDASVFPTNTFMGVDASFFA